MGQNSEVKKEGHPSSRPLDQNESEPHKEHRKGDEGIGLKTKRKIKKRKEKIKKKGANCSMWAPALINSFGGERVHYIYPGGLHALHVQTEDQVTNKSTTTLSFTLIIKGGVGLWSA